MYFEKQLFRVYLALNCLIFINKFAISQIEYNDSLWSELKTIDLSQVIDLPVSREESELLLTNNKRVEQFMSCFDREDIDFSTHDYLELLSKSFVTSNPMVQSGYIKFNLHEYARYPKFRVQLLSSSKFIYDGDNKVDSIVIFTKNIE